MIVTIEDPGDERLAAFRWRDRQLASRLDRAETVGAGMFVAEGDLVVERALESGCEPVALLCDGTMGQKLAAGLAGLDIYVGNEDLRREVTGLGVPLKALGLFRRPALVDPDRLVGQSRRIVMVEAVDNPTNLGSIMRNATALGWDSVLLTNGSADPLARRALRVSMGAGLRLPFARMEHSNEALEVLRRHDCEVVALTPAPSATRLDDHDPRGAPRTALLLGSERDGLRESTMAACDDRVRIEMFHGTDSINVAAAAAIALHHLGPRGGR